LARGGDLDKSSKELRTAKATSDFLEAALAVQS